MILACKDVHKTYGIDCILDKISFHLQDKEKAAVVGVNGAGKTTLFKLITGTISLDGGELFLRKDASFGYLEQNSQIDSQKTIYEEMVSVFQGLLEIESQMRLLEIKMAELSKSELPPVMDQYARLSHEFEQKNGYEYQSRIKGILKGLGFSDEEFDKPLTILSGGQKTRVYLGRLLLKEPELLLLDEPTNHLDIESIQWLEEFLRNYSGAILVISHDRYFMDRVVTKIIEIENKKSSIYEGNYSFYSEQKEILRQVQLKQFTDQQKEIKRQEEVIRTLRSFNREKFVKRAESREKNLEKIERVERPEDLPDKMRLRLTPKILSGNDVVYGENLSKSFGDRFLFSNVNFDVKREEKVAIIGPNGVGKSTLFKMILGLVETDSGLIKLGHQVHLGYYDQEQQNLDESKTIFQEIQDTYPTMTNGQIRNVLAAFVFYGDDIFKPISALSGGEKGRVALAKIMLSESNLLMLDEPTNHLDMYSKEILEDAILSYSGTVVYISHDRYFINKTAEKILELTPGGLVSYMGNYTYYLEKKAENAKEQLIQEASLEESDLKKDWLTRKEEQAGKRKLAAQIEKIEAEIDKIEAKIRELDTLLFKEEISTDSSKAQQVYDEKSALEDSLSALYESWEEIQG